MFPCCSLPNRVIVLQYRRPVHTTHGVTTAARVFLQNMPEQDEALRVTLILQAITSLIPFFLAFFPFFHELRLVAPVPEADGSV